MAKLVLFSAEAEVQGAAVEALKVRRESDYPAVLMQGLSYPEAAVVLDTTGFLRLAGCFFRRFGGGLVPGVLSACA